MKKSPAELRLQVEQMCIDIALAGGIAFVLNIMAYRIGLIDLVLSLVILGITLIAMFAAWLFAARKYMKARNIEKNQARSRIRFTRQIQAYANRQLPPKVNDEDFDFQFIDEFGLGQDAWMTELEIR